MHVSISLFLMYHIYLFIYDYCGKMKDTKIYCSFLRTPLIYRCVIFIPLNDNFFLYFTNNQKNNVDFLVSSFSMSASWRKVTVKSYKQLLFYFIFFYCKIKSCVHIDIILLWLCDSLYLLIFFFLGKKEKFIVAHIIIIILFLL